MANYPFATIDPSVGVVAVPDSRLQTLGELSNSAEIIPAVVEFVDIAGLVKGASAGEGLGNKFLANIREVDMIAEVVRIFEDTEISSAIKLGVRAAAPVPKVYFKKFRRDFWLVICFIQIIILEVFNKSIS